MACQEPEGALAGFATAWERSIGRTDSHDGAIGCRNVIGM
jgi:hypothetical protein